jgi:hypothetical protein
MRWFVASLLLSVSLSAGPSGNAQEVEAMTSGQLQAEAERLLSSTGGAISRVSRLLDETGEDAVERRECLGERLTAMQSLQRIALEEKTNLDLSLSQGTSASEHHFNMVLVATQRIQAEETLAQQCTGSLRFAGDTETEFSQSDAIPTSDVTQATEAPEIFQLDSEGRIETSLFL